MKIRYFIVYFLMLHFFCKFDFILIINYQSDANFAFVIDYNYKYCLIFTKVINYGYLKI